MDADIYKFKTTERCIAANVLYKLYPEFNHLEPPGGWT